MYDFKGSICKSVSDDPELQKLLCFFQPITQSDNRQYEYDSNFWSLSIFLYREYPINYLILNSFV